MFGAKERRESRGIREDSAARISNGSCEGDDEEESRCETTASGSEGARRRDKNKKRISIHIEAGN